MGNIAEQTERRTDRRYWLYEEPIVYETGRNAIRYYRQAGKIQIATCDYVEVKRSQWTDSGITEERKPGKLCALDLEALREDPETLQWLLEILQALL